MKKRLLFAFLVWLNAIMTLQAQTATLPSGSGTSGSPYQIASLENLYWIAASNAVVPSPNQATRWAAYYEQTSNIDASATSGWFSGAGWRPIGYDDGTHSGIPFTGSYNGQGHTISGIYINSSTINIYEGFVGFVGSGGTVSNLGLTSVNITGVYCTGGIAGGNEGTISNCYCSGSITANNENGWGGGIIGYIMGTVTQCYFNGTVSGTGTMFGGIVAASEGTILQCYNTGSVTGSNYVGGIVGYTLGMVANCYNKGTISGANEIGGIAGENDNTINYCFNIGSVSGTGSNIGAIAGADGGGGTIYTSTLWDSESSGITQGAGWTTPDPFGITGKTTAQMKSAGTFTTAGWDFTLSGDFWGINGTDNNGYPWLRFDGYTSSNIWLGTSSTAWSTTNNWSEGVAPTSSNDVIIADASNDPNIAATVQADCNNLKLESGSSLTIQSSNLGTGSLIIHGTTTGNATCQRYMTGSAWHLVSPISAGGSISTFIQAAGNAIPINGSNYGMMDYNETSNLWNSYYTAATVDNFTAGKGYCVRRTGDGTVTFTGTLTSGTKAVSLTKVGEGWNCVGNPYTSSVGINADAGTTNNFLQVNAIDHSYIDPSYCVYVWDDATKTYKIVNNAPVNPRDLGVDLFAPGQAFFVKAASAGVSIEFNQNMQVHSTAAAYKSTSVTWPSITLDVSNNITSASAVVAFSNSMTNGLDPTYDAGLLRGSNGLSVYTRLVEDNGVDFAIQCLPEAFDKVVIPVGVDCGAGGEVTFSATINDLPADCSLLLEDKVKGILTPLGNNGSYTVTIDQNSGGIGRFYIHLYYETTLVSPVASLPLKVYPANGNIYIIGNPGRSATAYLSDLTGRNLGHYNLVQGNSNTIPAGQLKPGVYLLNVTDGMRQRTSKIVIK